LAVLCDRSKHVFNVPILFLSLWNGVELFDPTYIWNLYCQLKHFRCTKLHRSLSRSLDGRTDGRKDMTNIKFPFFKSPEHIIYMRYSEQLVYLFPPFCARHCHDDDVKCGNIVVTLCHATCEKNATICMCFLISCKTDTKHNFTCNSSGSFVTIIILCYSILTDSILHKSQSIKFNNF